MRKLSEDIIFSPAFWSSVLLISRKLHKQVWQRNGDNEFAALAVLILTLDCSLAALLPTLATAFGTPSLINLYLPYSMAKMYMFQVDVFAVFICVFLLFFLREVWKIGALFAAS